MPEFSYIRAALPPDQLAPIRDALLSSPFVAKTTLNGLFDHSRGFAISFKDAGRAALAQRFPSLANYFSRVLGEPAVRAVQSWWGRLRRHPVVIPNAWYLNLLLVGEGGKVGPHKDGTLANPAGVPGATPEVVSVLYLHVPRRAGGELVLAREGRLKGVVVPSTGGLLHFKGDLLHEVRPVEGVTDGSPRASLVIEQYHFAEDALARLPDFQLDSRAGFGVFLEHHAKQPPKQFELEP